MKAIARWRAESHIRSIQDRYLKEDERNEALTGAIRIIRMMFTRRGHFLMEFIQNAEDAGATRFKAILRGRTLEICNNGRPFTKEDVKSICSIGQSSKDPSIYIGYLGVGFKAVFLVSNKVCIYSPPYTFAFDREHWTRTGRDVSKIPWQITPIWLPKVDEHVGRLLSEGWTTVFQIELENKEAINAIGREFNNLNPRVILFLHNIEEIELEAEDYRKIIRKIVEPYKKFSICRIRTVSSGAEEERNYVLFSKIVTVPEYVRRDKFTIEWGREKVEKREISVAFLLDEEGHIRPEPRGTAHLGVFSFLPLKEEISGLQFLVQADFLTVPGREALNREAKWNEWLLQELAKFIIEEIIPVLKEHEVWRYEFLEALYSGDRVSNELFNKHLYQHIKSFLLTTPSIIDYTGNFVKISNAINVSKDILSLISPKAIERITSRKVIHPNTKVPEALVHHIYTDTRTFYRNKVYEVIGIKNFVSQYLSLKNIDKFKEVFDENWLKYYKEILEKVAESYLSYSESYRKRRYLDEYKSFTAGLDEEGNVFVHSLYVGEPDVEKLAKKYFPGKYRFLHPELREEKIVEYLRELGIVNILRKEEVEGAIRKEKAEELISKLASPELNLEDKQKVINDFLETFFHVGLDSRTWNKLADKLIEMTSDENLPNNFKIWITQTLRTLFDSGRISEYVLKGLTVKTKDGSWVRAEDAFFSSGYRPEEDLERLVKQGLLDDPELKFLSEEYINDRSPESIARLREFFMKAGVGAKLEEKSKRYVEKVSVNAALRYIRNNIDPDARALSESEARGKGYDIESSIGSIEVKGFRKTGDVQLKPLQYRRLIKSGEKAFLYIVVNALKDPELYIIDGKTLEEFTFKKVIPGIILRELDWKEIARYIGKVSS